MIEAIYVAIGIATLIYFLFKKKPPEPPPPIPEKLWDPLLETEPMDIDMDIEPILPPDNDYDADSESSSSNFVIKPDFYKDSD